MNLNFKGWDNAIDKYNGGRAAKYGQNYLQSVKNMINNSISPKTMLNSSKIPYTYKSKIFSKIFITLIFISMISCKGKSQEMSLSKILNKKNIGKEFVFYDKKEKNVRLKTVYLGEIYINKEISYKIVNEALIWGNNSHTTGVIKVFSNKNILLGKYILGDMFDLPYRIINNNLIFNNDNKETCDRNVKTSISFAKGIPKDIYILCKSDSGDIYSYLNNAH